VHLSVKFLLLAVLKDQFLYAQIPTGFTLAYGPLLLVITAASWAGPMRSRIILAHFVPFLVLSLIYLVFVVAGASGSISRGLFPNMCRVPMAADPSIYGYPIYVRSCCGAANGRKRV